MIASSLIKQFSPDSLPLDDKMKKRRIQWPFGNAAFVAYEIEAVAGLLVVRRNHALVQAGSRWCQGWDIWLEGKFAGALSSRSLRDLATLSRTELLRATRAACCGRHRDFHPEQPSWLRRPRGGVRPNAGRPPKQGVKRIKLNLYLASATLAWIDSQRGTRTRGEYLDSLVPAAALAAPESPS